MGALLKAFGKQSLEEAARKGDEAKVLKQINKGADLNRASSNPKLLGRTPLQAAVEAGQKAMVELLINRGADFDMQDSVGRTALHYAVQFDNNAVIKVLLDCGADYTLRDKRGHTPIQSAIFSKNMEAKEILLAHALEFSMEFEYYEGGHWYPYDEAASRLLGFELGEGVGFAALSLSPENNYIVDFEGQFQMNVSSLFTKSVSWRVLPNGKWHRPAEPLQGLHLGSQDPGLLLKYDAILRSMVRQGIPVCPIYFQLHDSIARANPASLGPAYARRGYPEPSQPFRPSQPPFPRQLAPASAEHVPAGPQIVVPGGAVTGWGVGGGEGSEPSTPLQRHQPGTTEMGEGPAAAPSFSAREYEGWVGGSVDAVTLQPLRSGSEEFNDVAIRFMKGMQKNPTSLQGSQGGGGGPIVPLRPVTVSAVARIILPMQRVEPFTRACASLKERWGNENVKRGWHGAPRPALERIIQTGFVLGAHGRNGRLYGDGIYLSAEEYARTSAEFADADANGVKHLLLCNVALGSVEQVPFESQQRRPSNAMRYDTGVDNLQHPTRFIVWEDDMNDYILPTHLISFRYC